MFFKATSMQNKQKLLVRQRHTRWWSTSEQCFLDKPTCWNYSITAMDFKRCGWYLLRISPTWHIRLHQEGYSWASYIQTRVRCLQLGYFSAEEVHWEVVLLFIAGIMISYHCMLSTTGWRILHSTAQVELAVPCTCDDVASGIYTLSSLGILHAYSTDAWKLFSTWEHLRVVILKRR